MRLRLAAAAVAIAIAVAACGSSAGDPVAFCDQLGGIAGDLAPFPEDSLAGLDRLRDVAPPDVRDSVDALRRFAEAFEAIDESDPDALDQVVAIAFDPELERAVSELDAYAAAECGFDLNDPPAAVP